MQADDLEDFASRALQNIPTDEEGAPLRCYLRIRVGRRQSHSRTVASSIAMGSDPGALADDLRARLASLRGDPDAPRAWVEALVRGEAAPWDTATVSLEADELDEPTVPTSAASTGERGMAWLLVRQGDAIVRLGEGANRRAADAEARAARLVERVAELRVEAETARIEAEQEGGGSRAIADAIGQALPLIGVVAARLAGGAPPAPAELPAPAEVVGEVDADQLADELEELLATLDDDQRERVRARLTGGAA